MIHIIAPAWHRVNSLSGFLDRFLRHPRWVWADWTVDRAANLSYTHPAYVYSLHTGFVKGGNHVPDRGQVRPCSLFSGAAAHLKEEKEMPRVSLNQTAPAFSLPDFSGNTVSLSWTSGFRLG